MSTRSNAPAVDAMKVASRLLVAAKLLYQNAEGCAVNHYGEDFARHGTPGWLADCAADIKAAEALGADALSAAAAPLQDRVQPWMIACFGPEVSADRLERGDRFLEEALELLQSGNYPRERIAALTGYVFDRPAGEPAQEVGGVMITLAAYCLAHGLNMHAAGEAELARIWTKVDKIRAKQAAKPRGSALPVAMSAALAAQAPGAREEVPVPLYKRVEAILDEHSAWIARPNDEVTKRVALAAMFAAHSVLIEEEAPEDVWLRQEDATPAPSQQPAGEEGGLAGCCRRGSDCDCHVTELVAELRRDEHWYRKIRPDLRDRFKRAADKIEADAARIAELEKREAALRETIQWHGRELVKMTDRVEAAEARATKAEADVVRFAEIALKHHEGEWRKIINNLPNLSDKAFARLKKAPVVAKLLADIDAARAALGRG